jgi:hypothetical protein
LVTKREVLEELTLPKLKKIAQRLGIQVRKGITGFLGEKALGVEVRGPFIETLANSPIVTLEEIDRALGTNYSGKSIPREPRQAKEERLRQPSSLEQPEDEEDEGEGNLGLEYILGRYLYKEDLQEICEELELTVSGSKDDLIERVLSDDDFNPEMALSYIDKDGLKSLAEELELRTGGTREDLERRILDTITPESAVREATRPAPPHPAETVARPTRPAALESSASIPRPPARRELFAPQTPGELPLEFPEEPPSSLIPEPRAPFVAQLQMVTEVLDAYRPSQRFRNEQAYEIEVAQSMRHHFGAENVKTQVNIAGGRIDIEALGIGIEIKVPNARSKLQTLLGQVSVYRNYYGPNLLVVIFNDFAKVQDVNEFSNLLRGRGVPVFVK